ncbi:putative thioesterase [Leuconostoc kimchii IMSNU 11154]|uniref:Putative thioesterase n=1 Tax=Leuconostoc kimchii (strain IMSNU 11154 / KCTC 2386 / IH25) TaxID=762051 RepID=D5T055_LEUKI|nr:putative thioesterase [Leuconostoc kimchii IMSNU 11154]
MFYPKHANRLPAIIVLSGSEGGIEKAQSIAQLLANHGFSALAIGYFNIKGLTSNLSQIPIEIIKSAIDFLKSHDVTDKDRIGIYGRSKGAEFALLAASYYTQIKCVVINSPSNIVYEGISHKRLPIRKSSWSYKGKDINYFPFSYRSFIWSKIKNQSFPIVRENSEYEIPVEKTNGNIFCVFSTKDEIWNAELATTRIEKRLKRYQFKNKLRIMRVEHTGHMLTVPFQPNNRYKSISQCRNYE